MRKSSHDIEIISQGEVDPPDRRAMFRLYPALTETELFDPSIPVYYASALPIRYLSGLWSANRTVRLLERRHALLPFDLVLIQTMKPAQLACAHYAIRRLR